MEKVLTVLKNAKYLVVFTGAGVSVESGIPTFRGEGGLFNKFNPIFLQLDFFKAHPADSWRIIKEVFYDVIGQAHPNEAHMALSAWEKAGLVKAVITQNIDNLHQEAGSKTVIEFHGNYTKLVCTSCGKEYLYEPKLLKGLPPRCQCAKILKPDFIFFGEKIPETAFELSLEHAEKADVMLVIGTTGEVMPACYLPYAAKKNGAKIIEINTKASNYTENITDIFLEGKAGEISRQLMSLW